MQQPAHAVPRRKVCRLRTVVVPGLARGGRGAVWRLQQDDAQAVQAAGAQKAQVLQSCSGRSRLRTGSTRFVQGQSTA